MDENNVYRKYTIRNTYREEENVSSSSCIVKQEDIPKTITFKEIKEYFAKNIYVHIPPNKSAKAYAFIEYETPEMAKEEVDKYPFHVDTLNVAAKTLKDSTLRALLM